jgi:cytochrome c oxidase subunit 2
MMEPRTILLGLACGLPPLTLAANFNLPAPATGMAQDIYDLHMLLLRHGPNCSIVPSGREFAR